jgi:hypothetical protein
MQHRNRWMVGVALGAVLVASPAFAGAPFGGSHTGCAPDDKLEAGCGRVVTSALGKLVGSVNNCHYAQASQAFQTGHSSTGFDNAEENCTLGSGSGSAKSKFDALMVKAASYCDPAVVASATARGAAILADASNPESFDALNGVFYCDNTTGLTIAEPGGGDQDEAGFIPADNGNRKCSAAIAKSYTKLLMDVYKCHYRMGDYALRGKAFDVAACDAGPKGALARYQSYVTKLVNSGICAPCLASTASTLGSDAVADLDAQNEEIYPCP